MPEEILQFKIFISSPGDVEEEKKRLVVFLANTELALAKKGIPASLKVLYWKNIVAPFDGIRGQTVINIEFDQYDYYIGILGERFGTPITTEDGTEYGSGTEEEFRIACRKVEEGAEIGMYVFFKRIPSPTDTDKLAEYNRVVTFKRDIQPKGWVNSFDTPVNLSDQINSGLIPLIEERVRDHKNTVVRDFVAKAEVTEVAGTDGPMLALASLTDDLPEVEGPIHRTVSVDDAEDIARLLFSEDYKKELPELVLAEKRLVVLGNAGSGKSTELGKLVEFYKTPESLMVPVFTRLNTYKGGTIIDFLPAEFKNVPKDVALVILDGLDEVEQEHFSEAVTQINDFSLQYQQITLLISCRTNFFELAIGAGKNTLTNFAISHINEISPADIVMALNDLGEDGEAFCMEAYNNGYQELLTKPFFLNILSSVYRKTKSLQGGRDRIFREAINLKLEKAANNPDRPAIDQDHVTHLLTRLGLVMEYLGRNYVAANEIEYIIPSEADRTALENSSIVVRVKGNWSFEHNNVQEYFAAVGLATLSFDQIKQFVAFYPKFDKIRPSWLNTLSFLVNITSGEKCQQILGWIIAIEPESVIRFEPDRIDGLTRFRVFLAIFQEFQDNELWIRSNKFTEGELGRFGDTPEALELLKKVISSPGKSPTNKLVALRLLEHFKLPSDDEKESVKGLILRFISQQEDKPEIVYSAIHVLTGLGLADAATVGTLVERYRNRTEPYYRASLYTLVNKSGNAENYIDVFTEGILIAGSRDQAGQESSLWDETAQLKNALLKIRQATAINSVLEFFNDPYDTRYRYYSDKKEVMESAVSQATTLYPENHFFFDRLLELFINYSQTSDTNFLKIFRAFFEQTGTVRQAFESIYQMHITSQFQRELLLAFLLNDETAEFIVDEFLAGNISEQNLRSLSQYAFYHTRQTGFEAGAEKLKQIMIAKTGITTDPPQYEERQEKRKQHEQNSFDLLFDEQGMKSGLEQFWIEFGKSEATWNDIWDFANNYEKDADSYFPRTVTDIVAELSRTYHAVNADDVKSLLTETPGFEDDRMESIYDMLKNQRPVTLGDEQKASIADWGNRKTATIDLSKGISQEGRFSIHVLMIWFFVKQLGIVLPKEKLLDFTMFYDYSHGTLEDWFGPMEAQAGRETVSEKIIANLKSGIGHEQIWSNNAEYALINNLTDTYDVIKLDLVRIKEVTSVKEAIAKKYLEVTDDQEGLLDVLTHLGVESFRWELTDLLKNGRVRVAVKQHLLGILRSDNETPEEKLEAAKRLTEMANKEGFEYYADHILQNRQIRSRHDYWFRYLVNLTTIDYLPRLLDLLEQSLLPQNTADVFTRIDSQVLDALFNLGLQSEQNLATVHSALENTISQHAPDWNYMLPYLKRMDFQYYLNRSRDVSLETAIAAINALEL